jgi:hypothetical protein
LQDAFKEDDQCSSEERAALLSAKIPLEPARIVTYFVNREKTEARKFAPITTTHDTTPTSTPIPYKTHTSLVRKRKKTESRKRIRVQMWTHVPASLLAQVMERISAGAHYPSVPFVPCGWKPALSATMRRVCKDWQEMHDGLLSTMRVKMTIETISMCPYVILSTIPYEPDGWRKFTGLKALHLHTCDTSSVE